MASLKIKFRVDFYFRNISSINRKERSSDLADLKNTQLTPQPHDSYDFCEPCRNARARQDHQEPPWICNVFPVIA
jgi:hypothetical protein